MSFQTNQHEVVLTVVASDRVQLLLRNAMQMKHIVKATFSGLRFDNELLKTEELGFECTSPDVSVQLYVTIYMSSLSIVVFKFERRSDLSMFVAEGLTCWE